MASGNTGVASASNRQAVKPGLSAAWNARTSGNNIIQEKFEIQTGTAVGSTRIGTNITSTTAGIVGIHYNSDTKTINGQANITPTGGASGFYKRRQKMSTSDNVVFTLSVQNTKSCSMSVFVNAQAANQRMKIS